MTGNRFMKKGDLGISAPLTLPCMCPLPPHLLYSNSYHITSLLILATASPFLLSLLFSSWIILCFGASPAGEAATLSVVAHAAGS